MTRLIAWGLAGLATVWIYAGDTDGGLWLMVAAAFWNIEALHAKGRQS